MGQNKKVRPIVIPLHFGANTEGIQLGAEHIVDYLKDYILLPEIEISQTVEDAHLRNLATVLATNALLATATASIYKAGEFPLIIGGDHSVALGSISAIAASEDNLGVIWVDAHGDMNTSKTSDSGNIHGMILAALLGEGDKRLVDLYQAKIKIQKENVIIFGVRDLDEKEELTINRLNVKYFSYEYIKKVGLAEALREVDVYFKRKIEKLHISIDLDSLDPDIIPGVSVPVEDGFTKDDVRKITTHLFTNFEISSCDIVEYNPLLDKKDKTLDFLLELVEQVTQLV